MRCAHCSRGRLCAYHAEKADERRRLERERERALVARPHARIVERETVEEIRSGLDDFDYERGHWRTPVVSEAVAL